MCSLSAFAVPSEFAVPSGLTSLQCVGPESLAVPSPSPHPSPHPHPHKPGTPTPNPQPLTPPPTHPPAGHYHKPHTVPGTRIRYVGSPYQVSRAEGGQQKVLLVLDRAAGWEVAEELPLDFGPRFFSAAALAAQPAPGAAPAAEGDAAAAAAAAGEAEAVAAGGDAAAAAGPGGDRRFALELPPGLRPGDRLQLTLPPEAQRQHAKVLRSLQRQGVEVEVVAPPPASAAPRIAAAEGMGALQLFRAYAGMQGLAPGAVARGLGLLQVGRVAGAALTAGGHGQVGSGHGGLRAGLPPCCSGCHHCMLVKMVVKYSC